MPRRRKQAEMGPPPSQTRRITPVDIQQKEFRVAFRGYAMGEVDAFLDEVTEEVARLYADNKRLREDAEFGRTSRLDTSGAGEADAIIRQAREEGARIVAEARARASSIGAPGGLPQQRETGAAPGPVGPSTEIMGIFLARERAFLQNMANLIQAHAEGVKQDVRRVREQPARAAAPAEQPRPAEVAAPEAEPIAEPEAEPVAEAEPSLAEEPAPDEEEGPSAGESRQEIVDLTQESEPIGHDAEEGVLSTVPEGTSSAREAAQGSAGNPGPAARPGVEDDDAREDRSIRELFWGEG